MSLAGCMAAELGGGPLEVYEGGGWGPRRGFLVGKGWVGRGG